jgi:hypothetical protein
MTSDELKYWGERIDCESASKIDEHKVLLMLEIAYQLAVMNERMDTEDRKFFGGLPSESKKEKVQTPKSGTTRAKQV